VKLLIQSVHTALRSSRTDDKSCCKSHLVKCDHLYTHKLFITTYIHACTSTYWLVPSPSSEARDKKTCFAMQNFKIEWGKLRFHRKKQSFRKWNTSSCLFFFYVYLAYIQCWYFFAKQLSRICRLYIEWEKYL